MITVASEGEYERTCAEFNRRIDMCKAIFADRHRKYGPENIANGGLTFLEARRNDKMARIKHSSADFGDESLEDAWVDYVNYWVIEWMYRDGAWPDVEKPVDYRQLLSEVVETVRKYGSVPTELMQRIKVAL